MCIRDRVILLCHKGCLPGAVRPQGLLYNYEEVQACIDAHPGVVAAWLCAGEPLGSYARDGHGVHHLSPCAAVECDVNEDAYGVLQVFHESLSLRMAGRSPDPKLRPQGWPTELTLPQGGNGAHIDWHESLESIRAAEQSSSEVVLHLADGGMRFVPCVGGAPAVRALFVKIDLALRQLS